MINEEIQKYANHHTREESDILKKLNRETYSKVLRPRMLSGHFQGALLEMLSLMIRPKQILEIGTYTGYSAICLVEGLVDGGTLHTIDNNEELEEIANSYFNEAGIQNKVKQYIGEALDIIPTIDEEFDLIFIDADKENYLNYYYLVFPKLRPGGFIIADNVLWSGKVVQEVKLNDKETKSIMEFNDFVQNDDRVTNVLLPIRDGLMVLCKK
ncbi:MAG: O-methyltransferase [Bacteroidetes bacterium]|nr:O-methyltransferase [Bacteroidota bacterium]